MMTVVADDEEAAAVSLLLLVLLTADLRHWIRRHPATLNPQLTTAASIVQVKGFGSESSMIPPFDLCGSRCQG